MATERDVSQTLDLLAIFHYVLAAIIFLKGACALIMMGIGTLAVSGVLADAPEDMAVALVALGLIFFAGPLVFLVIAWTAAALVLMAGRRIASRTKLVYCQIIAGLECLCVPFGTILGVFTLMHLTKPDVKETFDA